MIIYPSIHLCFQTIMQLLLQYDKSLLMSYCIFSSTYLVISGQNSQKAIKKQETKIPKQHQRFRSNRAIHKKLLPGTRYEFGRQGLPHKQILPLWESPWPDNTVGATLAASWPLITLFPLMLLLPFFCLFLFIYNGSPLERYH